VLRKHETEAPVLPEHLSALERAVLQRCLQKDPAARYQSVHDLIAAFGAPSGVGAAAWSDVRAGAVAGAEPPPAGKTPGNAAGPRPVPPPLPSVLPPPLSEDPYAGLGRASREAARHAAKIARRAMVQARHVANRAAKSANDAMKRSHTHGMRRWQAWKRLREQRKTWKEQREAMRAAAEIAGPPRRPRRGWLAATAVFAALVFVPIVFMPVGGPKPYAYTTVSGPMVAQGGSSPRQTLRALYVPARYEGLVSRTEPPWALIAQHDREHAHGLLVQYIELLRSQAPLSPMQRATQLDLPGFEVMTLDGRTDQRVHEQFDRFLGARSYDPGLAEALAKQAPTSLVIAAGRFDDIDWEDASDRKRARRLNQFLEQTTGCRDLQMVAEGTPGSGIANKNLAGLWMWFVNEFGHTPRTWQAYRTLLKMN
ncbi:MAG TPA: hypothetical protein VF384_11690, partial [Planctomycetota bacterium]